ncbi:AAA family ATPase [Streptomyces sp. NPDC005301]|uniref:AAA family ATPase n=1 Tax=Streptomyces sp. NPDC005301 TaxID=3156874 RepID=UPI0033B4B545
MRLQNDKSAEGPRGPGRPAGFGQDQLRAGPARTPANRQGCRGSSDEIRAEFFGASPAEGDCDAADARIFEERDHRIIAQLTAGQTAVAESTNVTPPARARLIALARRFNAPVTMLRFTPDLHALHRQHVGRNRTDITAEDIRAYEAAMARHAGADQLRAEGAHAVHDVPGSGHGTTPADAAAHFSFM